MPAALALNPDLADARLAPFPPTARQWALLRFIAGYIELHGVSPTLREMACGVGLNGDFRTAAYPLLAGLAERGWVAWARFEFRGVTVLHAPPIPRSPDGAPLFVVPLNSLPHSTGDSRGCQ